MNYDDTLKEIETLFNIDWDSYDVWGSTIGFTFSLCAFATEHGYAVPRELEYRSSPLGVDVTDFTYIDLASMHEKGPFDATAVEHALQFLAVGLGYYEILGLNY